MDSSGKSERDFLSHLEIYLSKRDGVDKVLKLSRYTAKLLLSTNAVPHLNPNLSAFESNLGLTRKAFRLGKFIQSLNALRNKDTSCVPLLAHAGEGLYYFIEQFVWLAKSGLIPKTHLRDLQRLAAWAELAGYVGSVALKVGELRRIEDDEKRLVSSGTERESLVKLREKKLLKRLGVVQDFMDALMALDDVRDGDKGVLGSSVLLASAGVLSAVISTHKNWVSC